MDGSILVELQKRLKKKRPRIRVAIAWTLAGNQARENMVAAVLVLVVFVNPNVVVDGSQQRLGSAQLAKRVSATMVNTGAAQTHALSQMPTARNSIMIL